MFHTLRSLLVARRSEASAEGPLAAPDATFSSTLLRRQEERNHTREDPKTREQTRKNKRYQSTLVTEVTEAERSENGGENTNGVAGRMIRPTKLACGYWCIDCGGLRGTDLVDSHLDLGYMGQVLNHTSEHESRGEL